MKILSFVGYHNSGKTTLIEKVFDAFKNHKIMYIKHDPKAHAIIDKEGSDTNRILSISGEACILSGDIFVLYQRPKTIEDILSYFKDYELVILEGFKHMDFPKVKVGDIEGVSNIVYEYDGNMEKLLKFIRGYIDGI